MIQRLLKQHKWLKFMVVGGLGVPIHFGILYGLTTVGLWYVASLVVAIIVAASFNYVLNHYWTFRENWKNSFINGLGKYFVITFICDGIYMGITILLNEYTQIGENKLGYLLAAGIAMFIVMIARYSVVSRFVWRKHEKSKCTEGV